MNNRILWNALAAGVLFCGVVTAADAIDPKLIERGKYVAAITACNDCHTPKLFTDKGPVPDESKLLSGHPASEKLPEIPKDVIGPGKWGAITNVHLSAWVGPWGVSFATNLTPDLKTGMGSWTEEMFFKAMRTGKHLGAGRPILPPMPWMAIAAQTDADLKALYAYLKSIKPVENAVPDPIPPTPAH